MNSIESVPRLSPEMVSRKLQVLAFIRIFHSQHGVGPSLSEIAAAVGTNRTRVQDAIRKLAREGRVYHVPGQARGVRPVETRDEALRLLRSEGWIVLPDRAEACHPNALPLLDIVEQEPAVTNPGLPPAAARAHEGRRKAGEDGEESEAGG